MTRQTYSAKDLTGLKVAHDGSVLSEGSSTILTIRDKGVLDDDDDDVLENVNLVEQRKVNRNEFFFFFFLKKKKINGLFGDLFPCIILREKKNFHTNTS